MKKMKRVQAVVLGDVSKYVTMELREETYREILNRAKAQKVYDDLEKRLRKGKIHD